MKKFTVLILGFLSALAMRNACAAYGMNGYIGMGKETTWGTAVAATDFIESMSETIAESIDRFELANIAGSFAEQDDSDGVHRIAGDWVFGADPVTIGNALKAAFNTVSGSVVLSGFLFTSRFTTPQSDFAAGVAGTPYTLDIFRDVGSSYRAAGACLDKLNLTLAPNQQLMMSTSWIAKQGALNSKATPTFTGSPTFPFMFNTASVQIGGAATARLEAFNLSIDNQLVGVPALNNSSVIARIYRQGPQMVRFGGTLDFADVTEFLDFKNQTERAFVLNLFQAQSFNLSIVMPRFVYTAFPLGTPGRDRLTVAFQGRARFLTSSNTAIDFQLTSTKSNY